MSEMKAPSLISGKRVPHSAKSSTRFGRVPYSQLIDKEIQDILQARDQIKITDVNKGVVTDMTPKLMNVEEIEEVKYRQLNSMIKRRLYAYSTRSSRSSLQSRQSMQSSARSSISTKPRLGGLKLSLDDVLLNVGSLHQVFRDVNEYDIFEEPGETKKSFQEFRGPFIKITLRKTEEYLLFEMFSITEPKGTPTAEFIEEDNKIYDYLTVGRGMVRRKSEAETQTKVALKKTRFSNTYCKEFATKKSYVSFFEVYDTYKILDVHVMSDANKIDEDNSPSAHSSIASKLSIQMYAKDQLNQIGKNSNFQFCSMVMERMLAGNIHEEGQREFRSMGIPTKTDAYAEFCYDPKIVFKFNAPSFETSRITGKRRKAVSDISFCYNNGDIIAVAYGVFSYSALVTVSTGNVCIWSIKNPQNPERNYQYNAPVTSVEFSPFLQSLLAIGLFDGTVEVRNISNPDDPPVAVTQRATSLNREPVIAIKWFKQPHDSTTDIDPILALSLNGSVWKYRIVGGQYLLSFNQMKLQRIEGIPEGLPVNPIARKSKWYADRHPLGLNLTLHPLYTDMYYLLTDEGCIYKCSTNQAHSYAEVWRTHEGSVNCMDFSPWSPKLFLTCGNDWRIRIWMEGISEPLITLTNKMTPIYAAQWSRTHSTIIISVTRSHVEVWDIRRNLLAPMSCTQFSTSFNTMFKYNLSGLSVAFGDERGDVHMCALDKFPFPPHFQYDELKNALFEAISLSPGLLNELKSIGFFGYKRKGYVRPP